MGYPTNDETGVHVHTHTAVTSLIATVNPCLHYVVDTILEWGPARSEATKSGPHTASGRLHRSGLANIVSLSRWWRGLCMPANC